MIDVRPSENENGYVLFCPDCEEMCGSNVECKIDYSDRTAKAREERRRKIARFERQHGQCGLNYPELWTKEAEREFYKGAQEISEIYKKFGDMNFSEVKSILDSKMQ